MPAGDEPMGALLLEERVERPQTDPYAKRVLQDGRVYERTSVNARFEGGEWSFGEQPLEWRPLVTLDPPAVSALAELIRSERIVDLPAEQLPEGTSIGGSNVIWTVEVDGTRHSVSLIGVGGEQPAPFAALDRALQLAIAEALGREGNTA